MSQTNIKISATNPYKVEAYIKNINGYTETFCYLCKVNTKGSTPQHTFTKDGLVIT